MHRRLALLLMLTTSLGACDDGKKKAADTPKADAAKADAAKADAAKADAAKADAAKTDDATKADGGDATKTDDAATAEALRNRCEQFVSNVEKLGDTEAESTHTQKVDFCVREQPPAEVMDCIIAAKTKEELAGCG